MLNNLTRIIHAVKQACRKNELGAAFPKQAPETICMSAINKIIFCLMLLYAFNTFFRHACFAAEAPGESHAINNIISELKRGILTGEVGLYYEGVNYKKDHFIEDNEIMELDDSDITAPYFQVDYTTARYSGFSIGAGLTGYEHFDGELDRTDEMDDHDHFVIHRLYLKHEISRTSFTIGRQELEDTVFLSDYYEALSLASKELENLSILLAVVEEVAESDISKFIEFQNINRGEESVDDHLYVAEAAWDVVPEAVAATFYYYHHGNIYDLYGTHVELFYDTDGIGFGMHADAYATDEDSGNGLRSADGSAQASDIYHVNPFIEVGDFTLSAGYIKTDHDAGARVGGLIDDYFNPFNEGDKVYEANAETRYCELFYEKDYFRAGLVSGRTDYLDGSQRLSEKEFDIKADLQLLDNVELRTEFAIVDSESPEGDFNTLEMSLTYKFKN